MKQNHFIELPVVAAAAGDTTPNPGAGAKGIWAWSSVEDEAVLWDGTSWTLPGRPAIITPELLYGVDGIDGTNYYRTAVGGGEAGTNDPFGGAAMFVLRTLGVGRYIYHNLSDTSSFGGWALRLSSGNDLTAQIGQNPLPGATVSNTIRIFPSALLQVIIAAFRYSGTTLDLIAHRRLTVPVTRGGSSYAEAYASIDRTSFAGTTNSLAASPVDTVLISGVTWRGLPTDAQLFSYLDAARLLGDFPEAMDGAQVMHLHSVPRELKGQAVLSGQPGPAQISDQITLTAGNAMPRTGAPMISVIDTSVDERKSYGVLGFSTASYMTRPAGDGLPGVATGFRIGFWFTTYSLSSARIIARHTDNATMGWKASLNAAVLSFFVGSGSTLIELPQRTLSAADLGVWHYIELVYTGSVARWYFDGAQVGADVTTTYAPWNASTVMVGTYSAGVSILANTTLWGMSYSEHVPTAGEESQLWVDIQRTGRMAPIVGKSRHRWDYSEDLSSGTVPATIADRGEAGTKPLTVVGGLRVAEGGLTGFTASHRIAIPAPGLQGSTTGWWVEALITGKDGTGIIVGHHHTGPLGYALMYSASSCYLYLSNGTGSLMLSPAMLTLDVKTHIAWVVTGSQVRFFKDGVLRAFALLRDAGYAFEPNQPTHIGIQNGAQYPLGSGAIVHGVGGSNAHVPTDAEIATAATSALSTGKLVGVPDKTQGRWSIDDDVIDAGGSVPLYVRDRVGTAHGWVLNEKLEVSQRTERVWSAEIDPTIIGVNGLSDTVYYHTTGVDAFGATSGAWFASAFVIERQSTSQNRDVFTLGSTAGQGSFILRWTGSNAMCQPYWWNGSTWITSPMMTFSGVDVGVLHLVLSYWDPTVLKVRSFTRRAEQGTGTSMNTFAPWATAALRVGRALADATTGYGASDFTLVGIAMGEGLLSLAEIQSYFDAVQTAEDIQEIPGKTRYCYSFKRSAQEANNLVPLSVIDRRGAGSALLATGTPTVGSYYHHVVGW